MLFNEAIKRSLMLRYYLGPSNTTNIVANNKFCRLRQTLLSGRQILLFATDFVVQKTNLVVGDKISLL